MPYNTITPNMFDACVIHVGMKCAKAESVDLLSCEWILFSSWVILSAEFRFLRTKLWQKGCELREESALTQLTTSPADVESGCGHQRIIDMKWRMTHHRQTRLLAALGTIKVDFLGGDFSRSDWCVTCTSACVLPRFYFTPWRWCFCVVEAEANPPGVSHASFHLICRCRWDSAQPCPADTT